LIRPDGGTARVLGIDPQADPVAVQARTGYLPGELALNENLTAERQLRFFADMRGDFADMRGEKADQAFALRLAERLDLDLKRPIRNLSKGNKQKVGVIQALMHRPELLLLDEPTGGLDPLMQQEVLGLIREAKADGATVFFSSHIMSEVETVAERVGIIRQGRIVEVAETVSLVDRGLRHASVRFKEPVDSRVLDSLPGVQVLSRDAGLQISLQIEGEMDELIKALGTLPVSYLDTARPSLEEVFLAYYESGRENEEGI
jgi:ABC-2 type transport system ATP-binding protein